MAIIPIILQVCNMRAKYALWWAPCQDVKTFSCSVWHKKYVIHIDRSYLFPGRLLQRAQSECVKNLRRTSYTYRGSGYNCCQSLAWRDTAQQKLLYLLAHVYRSDQKYYNSIQQGGICSIRFYTQNGLKHTQYILLSISFSPMTACQFVMIMFRSVSPCLYNKHGSHFD